VAAAQCKTFIIPGGGAGYLNISDVGIQIETVDGAQGDMTLYEPWQPTDRADLASRLEAFGMPPAAAPGMSLTSTGNVKGNPGTVKVSVPWVGGKYDLNANTEGISPGTAPFKLAVWWHDSDAGTLRMQYDLSPTGLFPAVGTISTGADSPMGKAIGGTTSGGPGIFWSFDVHAAFKFTPKA
jgi:hypothetical protein